MQASARPKLMWCRSRKGESDQRRSSGEKKWPELEEFFAGAGRVEEHGGEYEGADGDQDRSGDDQDVEELVGAGSGEKRSSISARLASAPM